jgi:hypothetical protein
MIYLLPSIDIIRFGFGTVGAGFREEEAPGFVVNTLAMLPDGYSTFVNKF